MVRVGVFLLFAVLSTLAGGCGMVAGNPARQVGQGFADALDGRSDLAADSYLAPDATVYLQGGAPVSRQVFRDYLERMKTNGQVFHRMSPVYLTPSGAGWLVGITRPGTEASPSLWLEAAITSGHVTRAWVHFTVETLQALHQPVGVYAANVAAQGLPLPEGWAEGTPALLAAAERYDASADAAPPSVVDAVAVLGILAAMVAGGWRVMAIRAGAADAKMLRRYNGRLPRTRTDVAGQKPAGAVVQDRNGRGGQDQGLTVVQDRNGALLGALRERRQGVGTGTSIPV